MTPSVSTVTTLDTDEVDMTRVCDGCGSPFHSCMKKKWRKVCLHHILDYFENIGYDEVTST